MISDERAIEIFIQERACTLRAKAMLCEVDCSNCELNVQDDELIDAYNIAINCIKSREEVGRIFVNCMKKMIEMEAMNEVKQEGEQGPEKDNTGVPAQEEGADGAGQAGKRKKGKLLQRLFGDRD